MCSQSPGAEAYCVSRPVETTAVAVVPPKTFAGLVVDEANEYRVYELFGQLLSIGRLTSEEYHILKTSVDVLRNRLNETHC